MLKRSLKKRRIVESDYIANNGWRYVDHSIFSLLHFSLISYMTWVTSAPLHMVMHLEVTFSKTIMVFNSNLVICTNMLENLACLIGIL